METRKKILDLYENDEAEKVKLKKQKEEDLRKYMEEGDEKNKNKTYVEMKCRIVKAYDDMEEQEHLIQQMREKIMDCLGTDGFFIN